MKFSKENIDQWIESNRKKIIETYKEILRIPALSPENGGDGEWEKATKIIEILTEWGWENWILDGEKSGGAIIDLHIHDTDFVLYLTGKKPSKIYSKGEKKGNTFVHISTIFEFPDGLIATCEGGWDFPPNYPFVMSYIAKFEKAVVEFNSRNSPTVVVYESSGKIERPSFEPKKLEGVMEGNISELGGYYYELRYFIEHVVHNKPFGVVTPEQARDSLDIVLKEKKSAEEGIEITL